MTQSSEQIPSITVGEIERFDLEIKNNQTTEKDKVVIEVI